MTTQMAREFSSTEHVSAEAVAAYVDSELSPSAAKRAETHLAQCPECAADVAAQRVASERVRGAEAAEGIHAPRSLVDRLAQICETQDPIAARGEQGSTLVEKLRSLRGGRGRG